MQVRIMTGMYVTCVALLMRGTASVNEQGV
jgi:hypothetical protein